MSGTPSKWQLRAYGTSFEVRGNDRVLLLDAVLRGRALGWADANAGHVDVGYVFRRRGSRDPALRWSFDLHCDGALIRRTTDREELLEAFENHAKIQTAYHAKDHLFVHAGAVSWHGRGIVMPGRSRAGKSTLVRALVDAGAQYYSDEFAVLDAAGRLHPYAIPLSMRASGGRAADRVRIGAFDAGVDKGPIPVGLIVVTEYHRGARWRPRPLSAAEALLALMENTVAARKSPERTMPILRDAVLTADTIESRRGDARAVARALLAELA